MTGIGRALARIPNKTALYKNFLEDTQHKHISVHKGTPKDRYTMPVLYTVSAFSVFFALDTAWDMMMNKNRKVE